jgi:phosphatidylinositol alpha-1,6-mannosyltransferase
MPDADLVLVSERFPPDVGGSGELLFNLYSRLRGHRIHVLTDGAGEGVERAGHLEIHRKVLTPAPWGVLNPRGLRNHLSVACEIHALAGPRTVVHCARGVPEGIGAWLAHRAGGPGYACWTHGEDIKLLSTSREMRWLAVRVLRGADFVLANSSNTRSLVLELGIAAAKVHVIRPGVDPQRFRPDIDTRELRSKLAPADELLLLSVGRLQRRKGHDLVIGALKRLASAGCAVRYIIVGDGEERGRLEGIVANARLESFVTFAGEVSPADLPAYFAACDLFVMPNRIDGSDVEGFGIVFLEAAAAAKPAIGGQSGGVPEAVSHGETGLLVSGDDEDELASVIDQLLSNADLRRQMGDAGRARAVQSFTWDRGAAELQAILRTTRAIA